MKTKVKIIEHDEYDKLEVLVNEFIEKIPGPDLIDIKYSTILNVKRENFRQTPKCLPEFLVR